ncbi:MAG: YggT family protein [Caulobacterales bacterium]|nr:YggT family protein [Caulobacterales bacterium]
MQPDYNLLQAIIVFLIRPLIGLAIFAVIANAILSWLVAFRVVNPHNQFVNMVGQFLYAVTEPMLRPFRRFIPPFGGVDISPIFLLLILFFVNDWLMWSLVRALG